MTLDPVQFELNRYIWGNYLRKKNVLDGLTDKCIYTRNLIVHVFKNRLGNKFYVQWIIFMRQWNIAVLETWNLETTNIETSN